MKIWLICSKRFYECLDSIKKELERLGHKVYLPNCYDDPLTEDRMRKLGPEIHARFKADMFRQSRVMAKKVDAALVVNLDKITADSVSKNYIGGATFLEMYEAFCSDKPIFLLKPIPQGMLSDEIRGFSPIAINGDLSLIKKPK